MKIQYMSDLHLEFSDNSRWLKHNEIPVTGDVLVLAGDIFYLKNTVAPLTNFWKWASANYRQVLIVPGNHEYYNYCDVMDKGLQWKWMFKGKRPKKYTLYTKGFDCSFALEITTIKP